MSLQFADGGGDGAGTGTDATEVVLRTNAAASSI